MAKTLNNFNSDNNDLLLVKLLKDCSHNTSDSIDETIAEFGDQGALCDYFKMLAISDSTIISTTMELFEESFFEDNGRISLAYENLKHIPRKIAEKFAAQTRFLDLSYNSFRNLSFLSFFKGLHTLILDRNYDLDESSFPYLPNLEILWINNCNITNMPKWIYRIQTQCPNLRHLSMMGNPGARTLLNGGTPLENSDYRMFIFSNLPNLLYLDGLQFATGVKSNDAPHIIKSPNPAFAVKRQQTQGNLKKRCGITDSFRNLFRLSVRKRRKSYDSSTTS